MNQPQSTPTVIDATTIARLSLSALERTAFVLAEAVDDDSGFESTFATRISFSGPCSGECLLSASEGFVRELAAGLLSADPGEVDLDECGQDALNEFANIIGGLIIKQLGNDHHRIFLGLPMPASPGAAPTAHALHAACTLDSSGERMRISFGADAAAAAKAA